MPVLDLSSRVTDEWKRYHDYIQSSDSYVYIDERIILENVGPASVNITVGEKWYDHSKKKYYTIPPEGLKLRPGKNVIIEIEQTIALPYNVFGIVTGTGKNIFRGGFISSGKINPGYCGKLKIGYYNGGGGVITFKKGDLLACCAFFEIETCLNEPLEKYLSEPEPVIEERNVFTSIKNWLSVNWYSVLASIVSVIALIVSIKKVG